MPMTVDDYDAKLEFWARTPNVYPAAKLHPIPGLRSRKFTLLGKQHELDINLLHRKAHSN